MITAISRNNLDHIQLAAPGLIRTLETTSLGSSWSMDDLVNHLVNYSVYAFLQEETGFAGVFMITEAPKSRNLNCFWAGKDPENKTPINYPEVEEFMVIAAKHFGCNKVVYDGRKGWERILEPLGYHEDGRVYVKQVE